MEVISVGGAKINNLRFANGTTLIAMSKEEMASLLLRVENQSGEMGLSTSKNEINVLG